MSVADLVNQAWILLFVLVLGEWAWHLTKLRRCLRQQAVPWVEMESQIEAHITAVASAPGRAMMYGILGTAVGMVQALGAIGARGNADDLVTDLFGPGSGTTMALASTAAGLLIADITSRFSRHTLAEAEVALRQRDREVAVAPTP